MPEPRTHARSRRAGAGPERALAALCRIAAALFLAASSASAAGLVALFATRALVGPAVLAGLDALASAVACPVVALTARGPARLAATGFGAAQLLAAAVVGARMAEPQEGASHSGVATRLLCCATAAVVALALLAWADRPLTPRPGRARRAGSTRWWPGSARRRARAGSIPGAGRASAQASQTVGQGPESGARRKATEPPFVAQEGSDASI
ncbi:hypothetical protein ABH931_001575 [Streptacidiphilus sp. MAP12-33]|uniref:hypothetical protein n=1 Tax=Streptacidiphilus sp. MAP12-33 TaxID=3156266 RepID=UPI003518E8E1